VPPSESQRPYNRDTMKTQSKVPPSFAGAHRPNDRKNLPARSVLIAAAFVAVVALLVATCNFFPTPPSPTASPTGSGVTATGTLATAHASPSATARLVKTITLVASVAEPKDATPSGLIWKGVQDAGARIGAATSLVAPVSYADLAAAVDSAASGDLAVVVTIGPDADAAVRAAAVAHPAAQFFEVDVAVSTTSPTNVHGIVFDEAQVGYLAGFVAGSFSGGGKVGFVGDLAADLRSANYTSGFRSGASQAGKGIGVSVAYAGTPDAPDKGRTAAAGLVKAGVGVMSALADLSGIGAFREACGLKARLVAVDTDAWQVVPDVRSCLIVSVLKRYDVAVGNALLHAAAGQTASTVTLEDVATGGIELSDFHADRPAGFDSQLAGVLAALANYSSGSPPAPPGGASTKPNGSPKPSAL
jgi:basic membrane lipoprotein Med (substrate-binding protein (PBP1-ABC) superfamily)